MSEEKSDEKNRVESNDIKVHNYGPKIIDLNDFSIWKHGFKNGCELCKTDYFILKDNMKGYIKCEFTKLNLNTIGVFKLNDVNKIQLSIIDNKLIKMVKWIENKIINDWIDNFSGDSVPEIISLIRDRDHKGTKFVKLYFDVTGNTFYEKYKKEKILNNKKLTENLSFELFVNGVMFFPNSHRVKLMYKLRDMPQCIFSDK